MSTYEVLLATLLALGAKIGKSLSFAWIFQHAKMPDGIDTDNVAQLEQALGKNAGKYFRTIYGNKKQAMTIANVLTTKQLFMCATIIRKELKASDFTSDVEAQKMINALAKAADETFHFAKLQAPTPKTRSTVKSAKREITDFVK